MCTMRSPVLRHVSPRTLRLKIVFSFLLGVVVTATLFSAAWLELGRCAAGEQCTNTGHRLRRVLSVFGAAAVPGSTVDGPYTVTGATTATSSSTHRLLESTVSATIPTVGTMVCVVGELLSVALVLPQHDHSLDSLMERGSTTLDQHVPQRSANMTQDRHHLLTS